MFERGGGNITANNVGPDLRVLDGIASWCGGLHGSMSIGDALRYLAVGFGAEAAVLSRHTRQTDRPRAVAIFDSQNEDADAVILRRPMCKDVLGYLYDQARTSTVWFLSDHLDDAKWSSTQTLQNWRSVRRIQEIAVVTLAGDVRHSDYLEFHFTRELAYSERLELEALVPTLVRSWSGRKQGLVTQAQMDDRLVRAQAAAAASRLQPESPVLDAANPARLSRAEFRVCLLLSRGLSTKAVIEELALTESTVRSHLRSIYSKTNVSGMQELMYRLLNTQRYEPAQRESRVR